MRSGGLISQVEALAFTRGSLKYAVDLADTWLSFAVDEIARTNRGASLEVAGATLIDRSWRLDNWTNANVNLDVVIAAGEVANLAGESVFSLTRASNAPGAYIGSNYAPRSIGTHLVFHSRAKAKSVGGLYGMRIQGGYPDRVDAVFDLNSGTVGFVAGTNFADVAADISGPDNNGYYLCSVNCVVANSAATSVIVGPTDDLSEYWEGARVVLSDCYATGFQLEVGDVVSSYIPADGTPGSRAADVCTLNLTGLGTVDLTATYIGSAPQTIASGVSSTHEINPASLSSPNIALIVATPT